MLNTCISEQSSLEILTAPVVLAPPIPDPCTKEQIVSVDVPDLIFNALSSSHPQNKLLLMISLFK